MWLKSITLPDINTIINGCLKGNRRDQEFLYRFYAPKLYAVCLQYLGNSDEAKDVLQDGFIKIFNNLHTYKFEGAFEGWMRRIIVNEALERYRGKNILHKVEDIDRLTSMELEPDTGDYSDVDSEMLLNIINELPPKYKIIFNLFAIEGYSHKEISKMMKISEGTSKSNLLRARAILQKKVETYIGIKRKVANE
ncbi:MAG: sigma-70 family RNA polymerase sigma factor [Leptospirales bacterium]|nr:sigma-70 family RNA polymerase sigma factor [Leptospirales bacterium]